MVSKLTALLALCIGQAFASPLTGNAAAEPALDGPVSENGVLQRDTPIHLSGTAKKSASLTLSMAGQSLQTRAGDDGHWQAALPPLSAGGPYTLSIDDGTTVLDVQGLMIGDVLLCSGQSNMEYPVYRALNPDAMLSASADPDLRLLTVPHASALEPQTGLPDGSAWAPAAPDIVRDFSAVCYFTGKAMRAETDVPVGLIDASWGGSQIEAWLPADSLAQIGLYGDQLSQLEAYRNDPAAGMAAYGEVWEAWWTGEHGATPWTGQPEGEGWKPVPAGFPDWKAYGDPDTENHLGRLWYGRTVNLTEEQASGAASLSVGLFDDADATWLNGEFLGSTASWSDHRTYDVPAGVLKAGENTIIINVLNTYGQGGMMGPADVLALTTSAGETVPLSSDWQYRVVEQADDGGPRPPWETVSGYTTIHNAMIAPFRGTALAGAIWYQGESNAGRAGEYEVLLQALMENWRAYFGEGLPVTIVQLPGYGTMPAEPGPSGWSGIREAERQVALGDPQIGLAVTIDAGDRTDIHPPNKLVVANRVSEVFKILSGDSDGHEDGASPVSVEAKEASIRIELPVGEYQAIGADRLLAFSACETGGRCEWADASIEGRYISVDLPQALQPDTLRYCWGDAPLCNLFTGEGVPVTPFEVDLP